MPADRTTTTTLPVEWAIAQRNMPGESCSGDAHVVCETEHGALFAVIDGLGHGAGAHAAAQAAVETIGNRPHRPPTELMEDCHAALEATRGAVMAIASYDARMGTLTWVGVGDVQGVVAFGDFAKGAPCHLVERSGVVGSRLPTVRHALVEVMPGDVLIFATDGIRPGFCADIQPRLAPQQQADRIIAAHGKGNDDALVLVAKFR